MATKSGKGVPHKPVDHWANEGDGALVEISGVATAPSKDFYHVLVTRNKILVHVWKILPPFRADHPGPVEHANDFQDFLLDDIVQSEIQRVAGTNTGVYLRNIAEGHLDYLPRLPKPVLENILLKCDLQDISHMSRTSKQFRELCNSCELWEKIYHMYSETPITAELMELAAKKGWKRLFFTNKLQLQVQLRRMKQVPPQGGYAFLTSDQQEEGMSY